MKPTTMINNYLASLPTWQADNLKLFRKLVHRVAPDEVEGWKWNVPVFMLNGKVFVAMSAFKAHTKFNFMRNGALLTDSHKLFNNGLESKQSRGIDYRENEAINQQQLEDLLIESYALAKAT